MPAAQKIWLKQVLFSALGELGKSAWWTQIKIRQNFRHFFEHTSQENSISAPGFNFWIQNLVERDFLCDKTVLLLNNKWNITVQNKNKHLNSDQPTSFVIRGGFRGRTPSPSGIRPPAEPKGPLFLPAAQKIWLKHVLFSVSGELGKSTWWAQIKTWQNFRHFFEHPSRKFYIRPWVQILDTKFIRKVFSLW